MGNRRGFIKNALLGAMALGLENKQGIAETFVMDHYLLDKQHDVQPTVLSTWQHGLDANEAAWKIISMNGNALDAVEKGVNVSESDPSVSSVGLGGLPDASGRVTLDACIMGPDGNAGSVACLEHILHPVSVARKVMENSPHLMITGAGALKFALDQGFRKTNLLTPEAKDAYKKWKKSGASYAPIANWENHDTIGMIALDKMGNLAGACTTSGMAFKHRGRVGDAPIIGAGLYVDNIVGAATATGEGEAVMKTLGSFLIVELMRNGLSPQLACETAIKRLSATVKVHKQMQIGYIALNKYGAIGAYALRPGFQYALHQNGQNSLVDVGSLLQWE